MRAKRVLYNNIAAGILQITIFVFALIFPKLMITTYGSQLNGLYSSVRQVVSYLKYLELGITSALVVTLYKPLAIKDIGETNSLVTRAKNEYKKISYAYLIFVLALAFIYPLLLKESLDYLKVVTLIVFVGLYGVLDFYTLSKYVVLLQADQRNYIVNGATIITVVLQNVASIILMLTGQSLLLVALMPSLFLPVRSLILRFYIKRNYKYVDYTAEPSTIKLDTRKDAFINGLSNTLDATLPVIMVSLIVSLEMASVFSVYSMIFIGLAGILTVLSSGIQAAYGNMIANEETKTLKRTVNAYELIYYFVITVVYALALALIIPFIKIYTVDADINYVYPLFGPLFAIWAVGQTAGRPHQALLNASGEWRLVTKVNIIESTMLFLLLFVLGYFFSVTGILIAMIVTIFFKFFAIMHTVNSKIVKISSKVNMCRLIRIFVTIFIINMPFIFEWIQINAVTYGQWLLWAIGLGFYTLIITFIINLIFDWQTVKQIITNNVFGFFKKRKKDAN